MALNASGGELPRVDLQPRRDMTYGYDLLADTKGQLIVTRKFGYVAGNQWYTAVDVTVYGGAKLDELSSYSTPVTDPNQSRTSKSGVVIAGDRLYLALGHCGGSQTNCQDSQNQNWLYAIDLSGVGREYPEEVPNVTVPQPKLNYVALGDSFSSGEGVPPFYAGTDVPMSKDGYNRCHRSKLAYNPNLYAPSKKRSRIECQHELAVLSLPGKTITESIDDAGCFKY